MIRQTLSLRRALTFVLIGFAPLALSAQAAPCPRAGACVDVAAFSSAITDFRTSIVDRGTRVLTATVRFTNRTAQTLILGYVTGSGIAIDDQGNRYSVYGAAAVRAIGEIANGNFDPKFTLRPGESSDARFEFVLQPSRGQIIGTAYDFDLAIRQIEPLAGKRECRRAVPARTGTVARGKVLRHPLRRCARRTWHRVQRGSERAAGRCAAKRSRDAPAATRGLRTARAASFRRAS